jgi:glycosyltransferase involved in cell wall biosynthesis
LVISDNGSTDETQAICLAASQQDPRVNYSRKQTNQGVLKNFQEVLERSSGEFFMWLGDDDWLEQSYLTQCIRWLVNHPDYALACGRDRYYQRNEFLFEGPSVNLEQEAGTERVLDYYRQVTINGTFYGLMRRAQLIEVPMRVNFGGDWLMLAEIAFGGKVKTFESPALNRAVDGGSRDVSQLAVSFGLSKFMAANPHLKIAFNIFDDIARRSPAYRSLNLFRRLSLAEKSASQILARYCVPLWHGRSRAYLRHTFDNLQSLMRPRRD